MTFKDARAIVEYRLDSWQSAYTGVDIIAELNKMEHWIAANPNRRKKDYSRFIVNWLGRAHSNLINANTRHSSAGRQTIFTDKNGRYRVTAEGTREYIFDYS